jgi:hypothetical protein
MVLPDYPDRINALVCAMAQQAAQEAQRGKRDAALWLATDGVYMLEAVGADTAAYRLGNLAREKLQARAAPRKGGNKNE